VQDLFDTLTADLRLSLLVLGAVVIVFLILWELLQRRRARKADARHESGPDDVEDVLIKENSAVSERRRERVPGNTSLSTPQSHQSSPQAPEPEMDLPGMSARDDFDDRWASALSSSQTEDLPDEGVIGPVREQAAVPSEARPATPSQAQTDKPRDGESSPTDSPLTTSESESYASVSASEVATTSTAPTVRIEWPPEDQRRVIGLRVVGRGGERFTGASLRQALQGEGFVYGEMDIFHRPMSDGRVLMSAASLTQPGTFNLDTMDASLFRGLNLFAVLPGPIPGRDAVDKLLLVGHALAQRVRGDLQDGRGQPLTESRLAQMRLEAGSTSA
jgi:cell division protein ZipA